MILVSYLAFPPRSRQRGRSFDHRRNIGLVPSRSCQRTTRTLVPCPPGEPPSVPTSISQQILRYPFPHRNRPTLDPEGREHFPLRSIIPTKPIGVACRRRTLIGVSNARSHPPVFAACAHSSSCCLPLRLPKPLAPRRCGQFPRVPSEPPTARARLHRKL